MKKIVYIICLISAWFAGEMIATGLSTYLINNLFSNKALITISSILIKILASAIPLLAAYRFLIFIKSRSLLLPKNFEGLSYGIGLIAVIPVFITIAGYIAIAIKDANGLSGIPLGFISAGAACIGVIPVIYCEAKSFYESIPNHKPN
jgi:hypothetical protein